MQKKSPEQVTLNLKFNEVRNKVKHFLPVQKNGWVIKFSIYNDHMILLTVVSISTTQVIIRYCMDEDDAVDIINRITSEDSNQLLKL